MDKSKLKYLILFDIDGTILNFKSGLAKEIFSQMLEELFETEIPDEAVPKFAGMTDLSILRAINDYMGRDFKAIETNLSQIWNNMLDLFEEHTTEENIELLPGVFELVEKMHHDESIQLGLITGNISQNAYLKLKAHGLDKYFPFGGFGSDLEDRNMLPALAISRANSLAGKDVFNKYNTAIIGDTWRDIQCANINDIISCGVATGMFSKEQLKVYEPDLLFDDLSDTGKIYNSIINLLKERYAEYQNSN